MPYITTEEVKAIRQAIKKAFPGYKFSITKEHYSGINISVLSGPIDFGKDYMPINNYHYERYYGQEQVEFLKKVFETIYSVKEKKIISEDGDYGSIPNYYLNVSIGSWCKEYTQKAA